MQPSSHQWLEETSQRWTPPSPFELGKVMRVAAVVIVVVKLEGISGEVGRVCIEMNKGC